MADRVCRSCGAGFIPEHPWAHAACSGNWVVYFHRECSPGLLLCHDWKDKIKLFVWCLWPLHWFWLRNMVDGPSYFVTVWLLVAVCWSLLGGAILAVANG